MRTISIAEFIYLGTTIRYLQDVKEGFPFKGDFFVLYNIKSMLDAFDKHSLPVSARAAHKLKEKMEEFEEKGDDDVLTHEYVEELNRIMRELRPTIVAEASGIFGYITTEKIYSNEKLLYDVSSLMPKDTFSSMPEIARIDFEEAGKCIAFDRATAGAFHILRGTEGVLRQFYCSIVKRDRVDPLLWGGMTKHLEKRKGKYKDAISQIDLIRRNYRNPTQHPEKTYDIDECQTLFGVCVHAIELMVKHGDYKNPN